MDTISAPVQKKGMCNEFQHLFRKRICSKDSEEPHDSRNTVHERLVDAGIQLMSNDAVKALESATVLGAAGICEH